MKKITPHLWFDKEAKEATTFYISLFSNSKITNISTIHKVPTPNGDCDIISFELSGQPFMAINAGPLFKFNPSISFIVNFAPSKDKNAKLGIVARYGKGQEPNKENTLMFSDFMINNQLFAAMDSAHEHKFAFNEAISLLIPCDTQEEIDYYWEKLSADPNAEQCGWLKDKFGVSWQVWPTIIGEMMMKGTPKQNERVTKTFCKQYNFYLYCSKL